MKYISIVILFLFTVLAGCSANRASVEVQKNDFSVTPKYCYVNDCFNIIRSTQIQLFNDSLSNGNYKFKTKTTLIAGNKREVDIVSINSHVKDDIVTVDTERFVAQFNQKTREIIEVVDKTGDVSEEQIEILKDLFRQMAGLSYNNYASSGDVIDYDMRMSLQSSTITLKVKMYVHGLTEYKGKNYPLLEYRGGGNFWIKGRKLVLSLSGYALLDGTLNRTAKSVMDFAVSYGSKNERWKMILEGI